MTILTTSERRSAAALLMTTILTGGAFAHENVTNRGQELFRPGLDHATTLAIDSRDGVPPLYEGLGKLTFPINTDSAEAQAYVDQGWRLAWNFNHAEARRSFRAAQALDPACAMCFWGEAYVLGPNINDAMRPQAIRPAWKAIQRAVALREGTTEKERALIDALARRYGANAMAARGGLDSAWADAIGEVASRWPQDANIIALQGEALMNLQPWDYWQADGETPKGHGARIVAALEQALAVDPDHIGAAHLYLHVMEATAHPERAEAVADRLRGAAPAAGHLVHMPAHIYARIGRFADSVAVNHEAIAADEAFLTSAGDAASDLYRFAYYPHNVHFLMEGARMAGLAEDVIAAADKLAGITSDDVSDELAWVQAIKTAPYAAHAQFSAPDAILALTHPGDRFPFVKGFWHYARGTAFARQGEHDNAWNEVRAIEALIAEADMSGLEDQYLPARDVLGIAKHIVEARIEQAQGNFPAAEHHLREAVALEDTLPYMEPAYWYYPVRQTLGAVLLQQGRAVEAEAVFAETLDALPRNGWALWGLWQATEAMAADQLDETDIIAARAAFRRAWLGDEALLSLDSL